MKFLIDSFLKYRDAFALAVFFAGVPFIYYLRDGLMLAPNSQAFSIGLMFLPIALTIPFKNFSYFDTPNRVTFPLVLILTLYIFAYFYLKDRYFVTSNFNTEFSYFILIFFVVFALIFFRKEAVGVTFVRFMYLFCFISSVALIFYILQNPFYAIGQRAAFGFSAESHGNPHISSKVAYFGVPTAILCLKYQKTIKLGFIIPIVLFVLSAITLLLTQTVLAYLSTLLFLLLFFIYNLSFKNILQIGKIAFSKWYTMLVIVLSIGGLVYQYNKNKDFLSPAVNYVDVRFNNLKETILNDKPKNNFKTGKEGDDSANTRVGHLIGTFERLEEALIDGDYHYILFGQGYKFMYVDNPHLEMLDSFGIVGFVFFTIIFLRIVVMSLREMNNPENVGTELLAYLFIYYFIANFTSGQMLDYARFISIFIFCRFIHK